MNIISTSSTITALAVCLAVSAGAPASASGVGNTLEEAKKNTQLAHDWLDGKLESYGNNKVTYDGPPITLRATHYLPAASSMAKMQIKGFRILEKMSGGKIKVDDKWSGTVHGAKDGRKAVRTGLSDYAPCYSLYQASDYVLPGAFGLPFLFESAREAVVVAEQLYGKYLKKEYERYGVSIGRVGHTAPYHLYTNKPVRTLDDLKGMKIRAGGGTHAAIIGALGATQVSMPGTSIYTGLQRGTLDGTHLSDASALLYKLPEVTKYRTTNGFNLLTIEFCMSTKWFNGLPADLQRVVNNWGRQMSVVEATYYYAYLGMEALLQMQDMGLEVIELSEAEKARWREASAQVEKDWVAKAEGKGAPAKELLADIRKLAAKYRKVAPNDLLLEVINNPVQDMFDMKKE